MQELKIFEEKQIRTIWDEVQEKWYFCINDVIAALTDSKDPAEYFKKIRRRDSELDNFVRGTNCPPHQFIATDGKRHSAKCMDLQSLFRLVQSIPSKKAEPFKRWLAQVGADNITKEEHPQTMSEHARVAVRGGSVAKVAKEAFEAQTGKKVVSSLNMKQYLESQQPTIGFDKDEV